MAISLKVQIRVVMITLALMIAGVAVQAQSGRATAGGVVADESAARQGKFVGVIYTLKVNNGSVTSTQAGGNIY